MLMFGHDSKHYSEISGGLKPLNSLPPPINTPPVPCPERFSQVAVFTSGDFEIRVRHVIFSFTTRRRSKETAKRPRIDSPLHLPRSPPTPSSSTLEFERIFFNYYINILTARSTSRRCFDVGSFRAAVTVLLDEKQRAVHDQLLR